MKIKTLVILLAIIGIIMIGPKVSTNENISLEQVESDLATKVKNIYDLDSYLQGSEKSFRVQSNGTKIVQWYNGIAKTEYAIIYLHGYSSSRTEIEPVPSLVANNLKANIYFARYKGHGLVERSGDSFKGVNLMDWDKDTLEALAIGQMIGQKIIIMGHSTGSTFGTWLAYKYPDKIFAQLYLAPNYLPKDPFYPILEKAWGRHIFRLVHGYYYEVEPRKDHELDEPIWNDKMYYDALFSMVSIVKRVRTYNFSKISTPIAIILADDDKIVKSSYTEKVFAQYGTSKKELLKINSSTSKSQHTITGEIRDSSTIPQVVDFYSNFIKHLDSNME